MNPTSTTVSLTGAGALRALARAFGHIGEFDRFVQGLQAALDRTAWFPQATLTVDRALAEGGGEFPPGTLTLPLAADGAAYGALRVAPRGEARRFDAEDLHLLAGLADFLSAALTQAYRAQDAVHQRELLRFLLNQAPVGLAAYTPDRRQLVANDLAQQWLGEAGPPFIEFEAGPGSFYIRSGGKLIYGEARRAPDGVWVIALHDLTSAQVRLMETLQREVYRGLVEKRPVTLLLVESAGMQHGVMRRLPALRETLGAGELAGPYDASRVGVVLSGFGSVMGRRRLRQWQELFSGLEGLRAGTAELGRDGATPEALLESALRQTGTYPEVARPAILVHEGDPGVADSIALLLRADYRVVRSRALPRTRELLRSEEFDLLITDLEPRGEATGLQLAAEAQRLQPVIRPLFTCAGETTRGLPTELVAEGAVVVAKPFRANELKRAVRDRLAT